MALEVEQKRSIAWKKIVLIVVLGAVIAGLVWWFFLKPKPVVPAYTPKKVVASQVYPESVSSNTLFFGNMFWGRYTNDWSMASPLKTKYPFAGLHELDRSKYDAWITGLECPSVAGVSLTSAEMEATLTFNCSPDYLPEAAKWITAVSLANNHTDNQGVAGFAETQQQLDKVGIQYIGHYDYNKLNDICEVISLPVHVKESNTKVDKAEVPIALCGYHWVFGIPPAASLAVMKKYSEIMPVIAMPHGGAEYQPGPDEIKTTLYRQMIDNGADMVLGDHPHWVQSTESYKGHLIVYSMGNFMFDQQDNPEVTRSAAINVQLSVNRTDTKELSEWLKIGKQCRAYHDTCLAMAHDEYLHKLPFSYAFGVVGTDDSNKQTHKASAALEVQILQRLNWKSTMSQLQSPYRSL